MKGLLQALAYGDTSARDGKLFFLVFLGETNGISMGREKERRG